MNHQLATVYDCSHAGDTTSTFILPLEFRLYTEMKDRCLEDGEMENYWYHIRSFLLFIEKSPDTMEEEDIQNYVHTQLSEHADKKAVKAALRMLFREILKGGV